jgi:hypothetical protein
VAGVIRDPAVQLAAAALRQEDRPGDRGGEHGGDQAGGAVGDGLDPCTDIGAMVDAKQQEQVLGYLRRGLAPTGRR